MRYIVIPTGNKTSFYKTVCKTREQAESEKKKLEVLTGKEWTIIEEP